MLRKRYSVNEFILKHFYTIRGNTKKFRYIRINILIIHTNYCIYCGKIAPKTDCILSHLLSCTKSIRFPYCTNGFVDWRKIVDCSGIYTGLLLT